MVSNNLVPGASSYSPLSQQGHSLQQGTLTVNEGQWSNVSQLARTATQGRIINNFQMITRGVWSSPTGLGWQPQRNVAFNSGAAFMDFGVYIDFIGNQTMLFQVGDQVYSYLMANANTNASTTHVVFQGIGTTLNTDFIGGQIYINELGELRTVTACAVSAAFNGIYTLTVGVAFTRAPTLGDTLTIAVEYDAPLNSLSTSIVNLPCMRSFVDNTGLKAPITVYCNGDIQPQQITGIQADDVSALPFVGTGGSTPTNPTGGQFGTTQTIATFSAGTVIANYAITATGTPQQCCLGPDGNVWYTDSNNNKVGKITPTGTVTEFALTTASALPNGICAGPDGRLWISYGKASATTFGAITTAGTLTEYTNTEGSAGVGITTDGASIYLATVNKVVTSYTTGGVLISNSSLMAAVPTGVCFGSDGRLWLSTTSAEIIAITTSTFTETDYSTGLPAASASQSICVGSDNRMYFTDYGTNSIGAITTAGVITEYPIPTTGSSPWGICAGSDKNIWFTENVGNKLGRFVIATSTVQEFTGVPASSGLQGICTGGDGNVWFCEEDNVAIGTAVVSTANPQGICSGPDGRLWFCEYSSNKIGALSPTGALSEYPLPNPVSGPLCICSDGTNLWFTEFLGNRIGKITTAGVITEFNLSTANSQPVGIVFGPDGNLWFTESNNNKISRITPAGSITEHSVLTSMSVPWGICTDGVNLYFVESAANKINQITTSATQTEFVVPTSGAKPLWIAFGSDGRLWFTENAANKIGAMTTAGAFTEFVIPTASSNPQQITSASDGNLYFVEFATNKLTRITTAGVFTEFSIPVTNSEPFGITDGPDQSIWFTMNGASEIGDFLYGGSGTWPGVFQLTKKTYSKPKYCTYFNNRMAYFGFDPSTNAAVDVLISNQGTASNFINSTPILPTDAVAFTIPGLGLPTGCTSFRLTNLSSLEVLLLGFQRGIAVLAGNQNSSDATTYQLTILTTEYGLLSNRCFAQLQNDMYFLTSSGVRNYSNLTINANLLNSNLTYQMQDVIKTIANHVYVPGSNVSFASTAFAVHHPDTLEVQYWYPDITDGSVNSGFLNQHAVILNYNTTNVPSPQTITPIFSTKTGTSVACGIEFNDVMYGGGYDGKLQTHYTGNTYNGVPIAGTLGLSLISSGSPQVNAELRQGLVITEGGNQNFNVLTYFYTKQLDGTLTRTPSPEEIQTLSAEVEGLTILGDVQFADWTLGFSSFPANNIKQLEFQATGQGPYIEFLFTTNGINQSLDFEAVAYTITVGGLRP